MGEERRSRKWKEGGISVRAVLNTALCSQHQSVSPSAGLQLKLYDLINLPIMGLYLGYPRQKRKLARGCLETPRPPSIFWRLVQNAPWGASKHDAQWTIPFDLTLDPKVSVYMEKPIENRSWDTTFNHLSVSPSISPLFIPLSLFAFTPSKAKSPTNIWLKHTLFRVFPYFFIAPG